MIYTIENECLKAEINSLGSELWSLIDKRDNTQHIWQGKKDIWARRAPNLFPVCGTFKDGKTVINGKEYKMPLHGFLRDYEHQLIKITQTSIQLRFQSSEETLAMYPFDFVVDTIFTLRKDELVQTFVVKNKSNEQLPFSIGYHTGYMCPFDGNHTIEDYEIVFEKNETAVNNINENLILKGKKQFLDNTNVLPLHNEMFRPNYALTELKSDWLMIKEKDSNRSVKIGIKNFPTVILWSVENNIPFVCVEPWHGMFESPENYIEFKNKPYNELINPNCSFSCYLSIQINK